MSSRLEYSYIPKAVSSCKAEYAFHDFILEHKKALSETITSIPYSEMVYQIDLAVKFMQFHAGQKNYGAYGDQDSENRVVIDTRKSVFEIIIDLYTSMQATSCGFNLSFIGDCTSKDAFIKKLMEFHHFEIGIASAIAIPKSDLPVSYCTMIIFASSDIESATDLLATAWLNNSVPWVIRNLLVQETIQDKFIQLLEGKLKPFNEKVSFEKEMVEVVTKASQTGLKMIQNPSDSKELKPTVVYGSSVEFFLKDDSCEPSPMMILNVFRTAKEAISLADKSCGGSISVWTEELCLGMEVAYGVSASCVWVNSHGIFNPEFPYTFRHNDYCYGSDYAVFEKQIKRVFVPTQHEPLNSTTRNRTAIDTLGVIPKEVEKQRYTFVTKEKNIHYEMLSSPYDISNYNETNRFQIVMDFFAKLKTNDIYRHLIMDTVYNQRKTVVIPYGVSFAN
ncbi:uncharacterized protein LOC129777303 [Toxorhynchites rutilus septentrionalis]|uniref:uncharacterized protein LOC129777303 n=1 Tax=Toxorhynchites rutilus septentrionalis TaxID=329112 RepID=UPI00247963A8|nr:uncharacterized protein LOC129777303 [Toxorhynchites rutilus septentrionalis]